MKVPGAKHSGEGKAHLIFFRGFDAVHGQDVEIWAGGAPVEMNQFVTPFSVVTSKRRRRRGACP